ncbi:uncharacterized protein [Spinacia oleracea]|uniref:Reverse transcriptase zinc-binding domain-containing protein n=1 Tax=Spinacia oleracea TaxID=3562 RepID=A0ABM3RHL1_SPIOL|nr:uncharacterized protein LOC130469696 [Spinacia oleracea]
MGMLGGMNRFGMSIASMGHDLLELVIGVLTDAVEHRDEGAECFGKAGLEMLIIGVLWIYTMSPKSLFILWLAVHGRLSTKDRLMQWGIATDGVCSLCGVDPESVQHLFFQCSYARQVWQKFLQILIINRSSQAFDQELQFAMRMSKKCTAVSKLLLAGFAEAVYCLWIQRNQRVFAGHVQSAEQIVKEIVFKVACRCRDSDIALLLY